MRLYKSRAEQASLRRQPGSPSRTSARDEVRPSGRMEYEVMAEVVHEFRSTMRLVLSSHRRRSANACIMHYGANDQRLCDGDLLLLDAGCEHEFYASDISRTFPINGRFTPAQRAVYEVVLDAQLAASTRCVPATTGTSRTRRRCAPSPRDSRSSICSAAR